MSWYLKYRPKNIDELGLSSVRNVLAKMLSQEHIPHAFLLTGPRGLGKTTTARIIAQYINCLSPKKVGVPCGKCRNCQLFVNNQVVDVIEIDAASNRKIDDIRQLRSGVGLAPTVYKYKVYIIDEVHMLTKEAFNALLKTLEEPPRHVVFILATTEVHKVPETIKSRCQIINYNLATQTEIYNTLKKVAVKERLKITDDTLNLISRQARGSFRDAIKLLEQISDQGRADPDLLAQLKSGQTLIRDLFEAIITRQLHQAVSLINQLEEVNYGGDDLVYELERLMSEYLSNLGKLTNDDRRYLQKVTLGLLEIARDINLNVSLFLSLKALINQLLLEVEEPILSAGNNHKPKLKIKVSKQPDPTPVKDVSETPKGQKQPKKSGSAEKTKTIRSQIDRSKFDQAWQKLVEASVELNHGLKSIFKMSRSEVIGEDKVQLTVTSQVLKQMLDRPRIKNWLEAFLAKELSLDKVRLFVVVDPKIKIKPDKASPKTQAASRQKIKILLS